MIFSIDLYSTRHNTFILKCFIQSTCTNLDGCQKEGGNFLNSFQKEGGFPRKGGWGVEGGSNPGGNYVEQSIIEKKLTIIRLHRFSIG